MVTFIIGIILIIIVLFTFCAIQISKQASEKERKYEKRKNNKLVKSSRNKSN